MSFAAVLLAPFALLFPGAHVTKPREPRTAALGGNPPIPAGGPPPGVLQDGWESLVLRAVTESFRVETQNQVRIEQHMTIRITPARPMQMPPDFMMDMPQREAPRFTERKIGRCLSVAGIAGVQPSSGNRLILFMRDRRMVSATLERACSARDFYSGFYVDRTNDGQICVDRDQLLSRSGANCKLTRIRQLMDPDE